MSAIPSLAANNEDTTTLTGLLDVGKSDCAVAAGTVPLKGAAPAECSAILVATIASLREQVDRFSVTLFDRSVAEANKLEFAELKANEQEAARKANLEAAELPDL